MSGFLSIYKNFETFKYLRTIIKHKQNKKSHALYTKATSTYNNTQVNIKTIKILCVHRQSISCGQTSVIFFIYFCNFVGFIESSKTVQPDLDGCRRIQTKIYLKSSL